MTNTTETTKTGESCKCCGGTGVQYNKQTGLTVRCTYCGGTGKWTDSRITWEG